MSATSSGQRISVNAKPQAISLDPARSAIIVVDMQNDFGSEGGLFSRGGVDISGIQAVVPRIAEVLAAARQANILIVYLKMGFLPDLSDAGGPDSPNWIKHAQLRTIGEAVKAPDGSPGRILIRDTWNTDIVSELTPEAEDIIVYKSRFSGFYRTDLDRLLRARSIETLVFTGCTTSICVESTIRDAMFRDYTCLLLADCAAEPIGHGLPRSNHDASLLVIGVLLGWVSGSKEFLSALASTLGRQSAADEASDLSIRPHGG
jgi:ureidoacrylate peracid hydrolase